MKKLITMTVILALSIGVNFANSNLSKPNYLKQFDLSSITKPEKEVEDVIPTINYLSHIDISSMVKPEKEVEDIIPTLEVEKEYKFSKNKIQRFFNNHFKPDSGTISGLVYMYFVKHEDESFIVVASTEPELKKYVETKLTVIEHEVVELFAQNNLSSLSIYFKYEE